MLSYRDIGKELGKNIFVYPLKTANIKGNSIDLTVSKFAFNPKGENLYDTTKRKIIVPAHDTACILTNEAIYLSGKIGGTCHSRVSIAKRGFDHIGTMLDPFYCGQLYVVLHNTSGEPQIIEESERIISLVFFYLEQPLLEDSHTWAPTHIDKIAESILNEYRIWLQNNAWANDKNILISNFNESKDFKDFKNKYNQRIKRSGSFAERLWLWIKKYKKDLILFTILMILYFVFDEVFFSKSENPINGRETYIFSVLMFFVGRFSGKG